MLHCNRNSLNLFKASQFGSTLVGGRPLRVCVSGVRCALGLAACRFLARASLFGFLDGMLPFFPARKRQNRRFGAGGEGDAAFEFAKRFSRPGLSLGAMVLKDPKPPHLCLRPAPNRNILRFRARFPTRWPEAGVAFMLLTNYPTFCQQKSEVLFALGFLLAALLEENLALSP